MITIPNARRAYPAHAPLPSFLALHRDCPHRRDYCTDCAPEGTVIHCNRDIERRACLGPYEGNA